MRLAVIPARGGSKRIPKKNIKPFFGKPMIAWSIEAALKSQCFDRVIVSTDDAEISEVAIQHGAEVPFIRPPELSDDFTGTLPVIRHAVEWVSGNGAAVEFACCIYATAPFIQTGDLQRGWSLIRDSDHDYAFSATSYAFPIQRAFRLDGNGRIAMFNPELFAARSQDLEDAYHDAGQFYWGKADAWLNESTIFGPQSVPVMLPRHRVQDVDTQEDWTRAEWMFHAMRSAQGGFDT